MKKLSITKEDFSNEALKVMSSDDLKTIYGGFEAKSQSAASLTSIQNDTDTGSFCSVQKDTDS
jgi:hypothetical protein